MALHWLVSAPPSGSRCNAHLGTNPGVTKDDEKTIRNRVGLVLKLPSTRTVRSLVQATMTVYCIYVSYDMAVFPPTRQVVPLGYYTRPIASATVHDATNPQPGNCVEGLSRQANRPRRWTIENQAPRPQEPVNWWAGRNGGRREPASAWRQDSRLRQFWQYPGSSIRGWPFIVGRFVHLRRTLSDPEWPWALAGQVDNRGRAIGSPGRPCARAPLIHFGGICGVVESVSFSVWGEYYQSPLLRTDEQIALSGYVWDPSRCHGGRLEAGFLVNSLVYVQKVGMYICSI